MTMRSNESQRIGQRISRAEKRRLHQQRREALARRQRHRDQRLAAGRRAIPGVEQMRDALEEIEFAQAQLREAGASLQMILSMAPLAEAYAQFKEEGGVTASDWTLWLDGETLGRSRSASKQHLRIVSVCHAPSSPHRPIGSAHIAEDELAEDDPTDLCAECYDSDDGPEAA
jgi:hypothetical protein